MVGNVAQNAVIVVSDGELVYAHGPGEAEQSLPPYYYWTRGYAGSAHEDRPSATRRRQTGDRRMQTEVN